MLASIPSPGSSSITIGPFSLTAYGLFIALGVIVAVEWARRRWMARDGDGDDISAIALWAIPAGLIGARLYHVATDWERFQGQWFDVVKIWEGGLGIPGGVAAGVVTGVLVARHRGLPLAPLFDVVAPAIPAAQAIGRLGNWFNQELFGEPSDLPWALEIDPEHRPPGFETDETFHPTFLYEALWNVLLVLVLLRLERWGRLKDGRLFAIYVCGYGLGRLWIELLRIDPASQLANVRVNVWMSLGLMVGSALFLAIGGVLKPADEDVAEREAAS